VRPFFSTDESTLYHGSAVDVLSELPPQSIDCCVTSPPYFKLRDYQTAGQIGNESTFQEYVESIVDVFREVKRVLRDDGTVWLNLGDTYTRNGGTDRKVSKTARTGNTRNTLKAMSSRKSIPPDGMRSKNLIGIPWRVAFALQSDGWNLRQDIVWHKTNCLPESVTDRCVKSHEYIFLLSKSEKYYFNHVAIKEDAVKGSAGSKFNTGKTGIHQLGRSSEKPRKKSVDGQLKRNRRSVWSIPTKPYKGGHFATFPPALIEPCILAGSRLSGTVLDPFAGSSTTGEVAMNHKRKYIGIEINEAYCNLSIERICKAISEK